jgi:signal transduction histidine kinase
VRPSMGGLIAYLPRGNLLDDAEWNRRHRLLQWVLGIHLPALFVFGLALHHGFAMVAGVLVPPLICVVLGHYITQRRPASVLITAGLTYCSAALVVFSRGSIEAHFHFFIIIGFIALYQDWVPFLWNIGFTVLSHGIGSVYKTDLIFDYPAAQQNPWVWSGIHGAAVLAACVGMVMFWRVSEDDQRARFDLTRQLASAERRRFTSQLLVNLARRNQSMLYRQLDIINQLEDKERDPDALAELFQLEHLATRVRRNAESLLVLSGEPPTRTWSAPVPLHEVIRAAIAETEDLERVDIAIDESVAVTGRSVSDLTHLLAELTENAVRYSPPTAGVTIRSRAQVGTDGAHLITIEDWGVGMPPDVLATSNTLLTDPPEVDLTVPQQLGFHVVARLARRHDIAVTLTPTPGGGLTAAVLLPASLVMGLAELAGPARPRPVRGHRVEAAPARWGQAPTRSRHAVNSHQGTILEAEPVDWVVTMPRQAMAPAIEATARSVPAIPPAGSSRDWSGWWTANEPVGQPTDPPPFVAPVARPAQTPAGGAAAPGDPATAGDRARGHGPRPGENSPELPRLNRRIPQSHLAPELQFPAEQSEPPDRPPPPPHPTHALSQYQASRNAAVAGSGSGRAGTAAVDGAAVDNRARGQE